MHPEPFFSGSDGQKVSVGLVAYVETNFRTFPCLLVKTAYCVAYQKQAAVRTIGQIEAASCISEQIIYVLIVNLQRTCPAGYLVEQQYPVRIDGQGQFSFRIGCD